MAGASSFKLVLRHAPASGQRGRMELPSSSSSQLPGTVPKPFLTKLYKMVDEVETNTIVGWTPAGDALVVKDPEAFAQQVSRGWLGRD